MSILPSRLLRACRPILFLGLIASCAELTAYTTPTGVPEVVTLASAAPAMTGTGIIRGVVTREGLQLKQSETGQGVPGARVLLESYPDITTYTDPDGRFELMGVPDGPQYIVAELRTPDGLYKVRKDVQITQEVPLVDLSSLVLRRSGSLVGKITVSDGANPFGADVFVAGTTIVGKAKESGAFALTELAAGTYDVSVTLAGYGRQTRSVKITAGQATSQDFRLELEQTGEELGILKGKVVDQDGRPMGGVTVSVLGGATTLTADDGSYQLRDIAVGVAELRFYIAGRNMVSSRVSVPADSIKSVPIELPTVRMEMVQEKMGAARAPGLHPLIDDEALMPQRLNEQLKLPSTTPPMVIASPTNDSTKLPLVSPASSIPTPSARPSSAVISQPSADSHNPSPTQTPTLASSTPTPTLAPPTQQPSPGSSAAPAFPAYPNADLNGVIDVSTRLTKAFSPYTMSSLTQVAPGATVVIEPGVTILGGLNTLKCFGELRVEGTATEPVSFERVHVNRGDTGPRKVDVRHLNFKLGMFCNYDRSDMPGVQIRNSRFANLMEAIMLDSKVSEAVLEGNYFDVRGGNPLIRVGNLAGMKAPLIRANNFKFTGADQVWHVILLSPTSPATIEKNTFACPKAVRFLDVKVPSGGYVPTLKNNYWGTVEFSSIAPMLQLGKDLFGREVALDLEPLLSAPDMAAPAI